MRIISGNLKGKNILLPTDKYTRPLRDLVKESIFNLLNHSNKFDFQLQKSNVLDLFSGSGSFGLECISRGAKHVTFVENYPEALKVLKKNISNLTTNENAQIVEKDCFNYFVKNEILKDKYDLIFLDPPFKEKKINSLIDFIKKEKILNKKGIIAMHRHKKDDVEISKNLKILDERNYGLSKILLGN